MITRRSLLKTFGAGVVAMAASLYYATGIEAMGKPRLQLYKIMPTRWTNGPKLKIAVLADIHATNPWMDLKRIKGICDQTNALNADIILLAGDFVNAMNHAGATLPDADTAGALSSLAAPLGVHAILGNHDYWHNSGFEEDPDHMPSIGHALAAVDIRVHVNRAVRLEKDGKPFWLAGLADQLALAYSPLKGPTNDTGLDDLPATLAQITDDAPAILMAHEPDIFPQVPDRISLTISGHTHGGQVTIFGWSPVMNSRFGNRYRAGHIIEADRHLVVSRGLGCTAFPVRIGAWPEIVLLELG